MIQDIAPHLYDVHFLPEQTPKEEDYILCFEGNSVLRGEKEGQAVFPRFGEMNLAPDSVRFLFTMDQRSLFLYLGDQLPELSGFDRYATSTFRGLEPKHLAFAGITGAHLYRWYQCHRFCGSCGTALLPSTYERAMVCPNCGHTYYPQISPAVIMAVTDGDKLLLSHYSNRPYRGYALLAGYCEVGETVEDTIRREVMEEVGLTVTNFRYYKSQPWPFSDTLLMGFYCDVTGSRTIRVDETELEEARWIHRDELTFPTDDVSLTQEMIRVFREGREPK